MDQAVDVLAYLNKKGVQYRTASSVEINTLCWEHGEEPGKRGRLYINVSDDPNLAGLHNCQVCGYRGNLITLMRHFGDELKVDRDDIRYFVKQQIMESATEYYHSNLEAGHIKWLREERGLTAATIQKHRIGWADGGLYRHLKENGFELKDMRATGLVAVANDQSDGDLVLGGKGNERPYDFLRDCITIPYQVAGNSVLIRGKQIGGKYLTPPRQDSRLFNTDSVWHNERVVVTEGEFDAMIVEQMGYPAVGSPGAKMMQDSWLTYFDTMKRVYIAYDNDSAGRVGAEALKEQLGRKGRIVELPLGVDEHGEELEPGQNDISEMFGKQKAPKEDWNALIARADRIGTLLVTVDEAYEEWRAIQGQQGFQFGFEELDAYINPGVLATQVCVPLAKTNVGKTLFLLNMFQRASMVPGQENAKMLFVSLEQTRGDWFERARRIWNFYNLDCPGPEVHKYTLDYWRDRLVMTDVNRMTVEDLLAAIEDFKEQMGEKPAVVAIDYLGYWARAFKGISKYEAVSEAVMSLKEVGKIESVPIVAPHQVSRGQEFGKKLDVDGGRDSGVIEETADYVLMLYNPDTMKGVTVDERTGHVGVGIGKSRSGGKGREMLMQMGYLSLVLVPLTDVKYARLANDELQYDLRDERFEPLQPWQAAIFRHKSGMKHGDIADQLRQEHRLILPDGGPLDPDDF